jgi:DNA-binding transcriptional MerR regulator
MAQAEVALSLDADNTEQTEHTLTIGALAKRCGVTVRTLRYYEEMDLIGPLRRSTGHYRLYSEKSTRRVKAIQALQDLGYSLEQILVALGPYTKTMSFNKAEQVAAAEQSLKTLQQCIDEKLSVLFQMKNEVVQRLATIKNTCRPCVDHLPANHCEEHCEHRSAHVD